MGYGSQIESRLVKEAREKLSTEAWAESEEGESRMYDNLGVSGEVAYLFALGAEGLVETSWCWFQGYFCMFCYINA